MRNSRTCGAGERLSGVQPELVVLEASGGYETAVVAELAATSIAVTVVNPRQVRDFARAIGQLEKSDVLDARILALFAERVRPEVRPLADERTRDLQARWWRAAVSCWRC